ncbi:hypothetical protein F444_10013 [Phytophthora nicotianae P1976]|uniref:Uncharacterized protein n=1 Tax=Phytophthora nicotianae P1976 TaxID=1317066 RepID=A0A081A5I4_PHYNI|nr:hypothetical protein F444_10013 [Phytophthora nicotianae P1976]
MELQEALEVEGVTAFAPPPVPTFRYVIRLENGKMRFWMEEPASKKQWYKGDLDRADYITATNAIPGTSASDFVKYFQDILDSKLDDAGGAQRELTLLSNGALQLILSLKISFLHSTRLATYMFVHNSGSVERIHTLEEKVRGLERKMEVKVRALEGQVVDLKEDLAAPSILQLEAHGKQHLVWKYSDSASQDPPTITMFCQPRDITQRAHSNSRA